MSNIVYVKYCTVIEVPALLTPAAAPGDLSVRRFGRRDPDRPSGGAATPLSAGDLLSLRWAARRRCDASAEFRAGEYWEPRLGAEARPQAGGEGTQL